MGLNPNIQAALEKYAEEFVQKVPVDEILNKLRFRQVLSPDQVTKIKKKDSQEDRNTELLDIILLGRDDEDFKKFCDLLKENNVATVRGFAAKLATEAQGTR